MTWVQTVWEVVSGGLFSTVGVISMMPLYIYPGFVFMNAKIKVRRISIDEYDSKLLRTSYLSKTLVWFILLTLYLGLLIIPNYFDLLNDLLPAITFMYLGLSAAMLSMEITSITSNYRQIQQTTYVPILKRKSFWVLLLTSALNIGRILLLDEIFLPSAAIAIVDAGSYGVITIAIFTMLFFDKTANVAKKYIKVAQNLTHVLTTTVIKDEKQKAKFNKRIDKVLELLYEVLDLGTTGFIPEKDVQKVNEQISLIQQLREDKCVNQKL